MLLLLTILFYVATVLGEDDREFGQVNGPLDKATRGLIKRSVCGALDQRGYIRQRRYSTYSKWDKTDLKYYVDYGQDLSTGLQDQIFSKAFKFWSDSSKLTFTKVNSPQNADIKISFGRGRHGGTSAEQTCPNPFDGQGGILAHAFFPKDGRIHFDEDEHFTYQDRHGTDLLWVATHQIGHALGLEHTNVGGAIMYPHYPGYTPDMKLHSDDIDGIRSLYGAPSAQPAPQPGNPGACQDRAGSSTCLSLKNRNYCNTMRDLMKYHCQKTCSMC